MSIEAPGQRQTVDVPPKEDWDPTHATDRSVHHWTTTNLGEAVPGILTPLALAHWGLRGHLTGVRVAYNVGAMSARERDTIPEPADRVLRCFYGRLTVRLEYMTMLGDRMPGVTGEEMMASLFGQAPPGIEYHPTVRRYPFIALRLTHTGLTIQRRLLRMCRETDAWWRARVRELPGLDLAAALAVLEQSLDRYQFAMDTHVTAMFGSFQPLFDMLGRLIASAGVGDLSVLSGTGGAEMAVVGDLWRASRGQMSLADVVANHGFHGPGEGEVSSRVWREDPSPLERVIAYYRDVPDGEAPDAKERDKEARRVAMTSEVLAALPATRRPGARLILKLARERIPDRGRGKRAFLQAIDITRMAARRAGEHWVAAGVLADPDDVFYLTDEEILRPLPGDVRELVARRRERRRLYQQFEFAETTWAGMPDVGLIGDPSESVADTTVISGTGASGGVVEGPVRVVQDPAFTDVEPGEILVAPTTDPSWCSIMFVSAALVVDLGGMLSHAAVVARELEIPCVVNAKDATVRLRNGDRVRVDGKAGTVEILSRAEPAA
jgi:phosphohistidine swiveling domain-containing protein